MAQSPEKPAAPSPAEQSETVPSPDFKAHLAACPAGDLPRAGARPRDVDFDA